MSGIPMTQAQASSAPEAWIHFSNPGEIDPRLIFVLGTNVKTSASAIGTFGTGLKYGIAVVLRLGGTIIITAGRKRYDFAVEQNTIRGKVFDFIRMITLDLASGEEHQQTLGFTTELGKNWFPWMAYREFYCNCKDEDGEVRAILYAPAEPKVNQTDIYVLCPGFSETHANPNCWLLNPEKRKELEVPGLEIYSNYERDLNYYYRGIKVGQFSHVPLFTYNLISDVKLTEDRTYSMEFALNRIGEKIFSVLPAGEVLRRLVLNSANGNYAEAHLNWSHVYSLPSPAIVNTVETLRNTNLSSINKVLYVKVQDFFKQEEITSAKLTSLQKAMFDKALAWLRRYLGVDIKAEIIFVESLGSQWLHGAAKGEKIYIPLSTFGKGTKYLASTLFEEFLHAERNLDDTSREMQDLLLDKILSLTEELAGEPL